MVYNTNNRFEKDMNKSNNHIQNISDTQISTGIYKKSFSNRFKEQMRDMKYKTIQSKYAEHLINSYSNIKNNLHIVYKM